MAALTPLGDDALGPEAQGVCMEFKQLMGQDQVPQFFRYMAHQPKQLELVWGQIKSLMDPRREDHKQKHLIALAVCAASGSSYFAEEHSRALIKEGATQEEVAEVLAVAQLWSGLSTFASGLQLVFDERHEPSFRKSAPMATDK